jgi:hypothetical protein
MAIFAAGLVDQKFFDRVWIFLLWMVPAQIPAVIYQRFFVAPNRVGSSPWDAVVGLFGGDPEGGGGSGIMAVFVIVMSLIAFVRWKNGGIRLPFFMLVLVSALGCIVMAEVKFSFVLIPIAVAVMFGREFLHKPIRVLAVFAITGVIITSIIALYQMQFTYGGKMPETQTVTGYLERSIQNNIDDRFINFQTGEMGRIASLRFWEAEHGLNDPLTYFLGHGVGSTKVGGWVVGEAAAKYVSRFRIDRSTATILLWDAGMYGLICMLMVCVSTAFIAFRAAKQSSIDLSSRGLMPVMGTASIIFLVEFPYHTSIANVPQAQLLFVFVVGYVIAASRFQSPVFRGSDEGKAAGRNVSQLRRTHPLSVATPVV